MMRKFLLLVGLALIMPASSIAAPGEGGGNGFNNGSIISGVYGGSGNAYWQEIPNVDKGPHTGITAGLKNKLSTIKKQFTITAAPDGGYGPAARKAVARQATNAVIDELCGGRGKNIKDASSDACPVWYTRREEGSVNSVKTWYKIHPLTRGALGSGRPSEFRIVAYNFRVWRGSLDNDNFSLIFERSISNPSSASDLPSPGIKGIAPGWQATTAPWWPKISAWDNDQANKAWWNGYSGIYYKKQGGQGGAISAPNPDGSNDCQDNIDGNDINGNRNAQGRVGGPGPIMTPEAMNPYKAKKKNQLKKGGTWCYWEGSDIGARSYPRQFGSGSGGNETSGLKESIFIKWSFDGYRIKGGNPYFRFKIEGAPSRFYIVQVAAIDSRQNLMPLKTGQNFDYKYQMIKAFMANGARSPTRNCDPPEVCQTSSSPPNLKVSIDEQTPLQVRQESTQKVVLSELSGESLDPLESALPYQTSLLHYTPQLKFSAKKASNISKETYPSDYVNYSQPFYTLGFQDAGDQTAYIPKGSHVVQDPSNLAIQYKVSSSPAYLDIDGIDGEIVSQKNYNITWYQPTLDNPCLYEGSLVANEIRWLAGGMAPSWPNNLKRCATPEQFDPSRQNDYPYREYGPNSGVPLVNVWDDVLSATASWESLWVPRTLNTRIDAYRVGRVNHWLRCGDGLNLETCNPNIPGPPGNAGGKAQSTVLLAAEGRNKPTAPLTLRIRTQNSTPSNLRIYARENPDTVRNLSGANLSEPVNLCLQGLPDGSRYIGKNGVTYNSKDRGKLGDPGCRGFAVEWKWKTDTGCREEKPTPTQIRNNNPVTIRHDQYTPNTVSYNPYRNNAAYGGDGPQSLKSGTVPFMGREPDTLAAINLAPRCPKKEYPYKGSWVVSQDSDSGWGPGNDGSRINISNYLGAGRDYGVFVVEFDISPPNNNYSPPACQNIGLVSAASYCWSVYASYQGYDNLVWYSAWDDSANEHWAPQLNAAPECPGDLNGGPSGCSNSFSPRPNFAYIKVFGSRTSR